MEIKSGLSVKSTNEKMRCKIVLKFLENKIFSVLLFLFKVLDLNQCQ